MNTELVNGTSTEVREIFFPIIPDNIFASFPLFCTAKTDIHNDKKDVSYLFSEFFKIIEYNEGKISAQCNNCSKVVHGQELSPINFYYHIKYSHNILLPRLKESRKTYYLPTIPLKQIQTFSQKSENETNQESSENTFKKNEFWKKENGCEAEKHLPSTSNAFYESHQIQNY